MEVEDLSCNEIAFKKIDSFIKMEVEDLSWKETGIKKTFFKFDSSNAIIHMNREKSYFCNLISACSEVFILSSLNINNIHDLIKEATPVIYYIVSWVKNHIENNLDNTITFKINLHFYDEEIPEEKYKFGPDGIVAFNFNFKKLEEEEDILRKLKHVSIKN